MSDPINPARRQLIEDARHAAFTAPPLLDRFVVELVNTDTLWAHADDPGFACQPADLFFDTKQLVPGHQHVKLDLIASSNQPLLDNLLLRDPANGRLVALFRGYPVSWHQYHMQFTAVHSDYRRQGVYSALLERVLQYSRLLGFTEVLSHHSPNNNPILIAKLKQVFKISGLEVESRFGVNVVLRYYHQAASLDAFALRCGHIAFNPALRHSAYGKVEALQQVLAGSSVSA